ncbi:MAG TPA: 16S rRNA (guanine(527)-N(7))-methyltransferase RsmG [Amaricoccus sp.]|uniref:16S rRNA (guanine(527)-N(7))-methyltransferase RsmG n=1 Tax=Amaricoccus sp. TaxID=1872485 RepID=UPI002BB196F0|nr:16S rRNA (guanine(527)-N(7))-methyltransferase RsmG [Amaricoccus sp.]HMQ94564.1 16S rRNA (guanine(527)-N(7))-methyltransferase RsmG [Amaricoccus sp.]HMR50992.1 16S rRNA (guanine(527)-N(7))-methyltransferase RsmG [Amaricoccus sp.]HMR59331.1 16S rRNA (guanine(527)-N(7))-methyltransferase RsmG [Amaricoccus sp.]HMT97829.1 16S rRNA (guanine(527)-N(7))-methyltransferase RsmG [Amaricoccus sp.]
MQHFETYLALLEKWNRTINLVSPASLDDAWRRHVLDSAQLWRLCPPDARNWLDLGSGAGFPGLVVALLARMAGAPLRVTLVESDERKCAFLRTVASTCALDARIETGRIEDLPPALADVISARALAPLDKLLGYAQIHRAACGIGLFPKGRTVHKEVTEARRNWRFDCQLHPSATDPDAAIVEVGALERV